MEHTEDFLLAFLAKPSLATYVRAVLQQCEERGWPFEQAWAHTMRTVPRGHPELDSWRAKSVEDDDTEKIVVQAFIKASFKRAYGLRRAARLGLTPEQAVAHARLARARAA